MPFFRISLFCLLTSIIASPLVGQSSAEDFFELADNFFSEVVSDNKVDYNKAKTNSDLTKLIEHINNTNIGSIDQNSKKAYLINAYNLFVIKKICDIYPTSSVLKKIGFFDTKDVNIGGKLTSLNTLEKDLILKEFNDPRLHFALVCGAIDCPPITGYSYKPEILDEQLEIKTASSINDASFIKRQDGTIQLSQIFNWYKADFEQSNGNVIDFINKYANNPFSQNIDYNFYPYNWDINDTALPISESTNANRYVVSATIPQGSIEVKLFNNLYSQTKKENGIRLNRSSFFTTTLSAIYGVNRNFNAGVISKYRRVKNSVGESSSFEVFSDLNPNGRQGVTGIGPIIRYAPVKKWTNFSIQASYFFPVGSDLTGSEQLGNPFIDWDGGILNIQLFNDFSIGSKFSIFTELDFLIEDIGKNNQFTTPATFIVSYFPVRNLTIYGLAGYAPIWQDPYNYFYQFGLGTKYQFTPNLELELLYTDFRNRFLIEDNATASTINLGLRLNI